MQNEFKNKLIFITLMILFISGCAGHQSPQVNEEISTEQSNELQRSQVDPYENYNRSIYRFNTKLDKYLLKPASKLYQKITPDFVEKGVYNFFENLQEPRNIINSLLQGKFDRAGTSSGRLVLNTTVGVLGLFDVARKLDIPKYDEDFGQTLASWGVPAGPYFVLPLFGPRYLRHSTGMIPDIFLNPVYYVDDNGVRLGLSALSIVNTRARLIGADDLLELQLDPYVFVRESYLQRRQAVINDVDSNDRSIDEFDAEFDDEFDDSTELGS